MKNTLTQFDVVQLGLECNEHIAGDNHLLRRDLERKKTFTVLQLPDRQRTGPDRLFENYFMENERQ